MTDSPSLRDVVYWEEGEDDSHSLDLTTIIEAWHYVLDHPNRVVECSVDWREDRLFFSVNGEGWVTFSSENPFQGD